MASYPTLRSIPLDAFDDAPDEVKAVLEKLLGYLNPHLDASVNAFESLLGTNQNKQLETASHVRATGAGTITNLKIKNRLPRKPHSVDIAQIRPSSLNDSTSISPTKPIWSMTERGEILIEYVGGLDADTYYDVSFRVE